MSTATASTGTPTRSFLTRHRTAVLLGVAILAVVVVSALASIGDDGRGGPLDPSNPGPEGARAVARVLEQQSVQVQVARGQAAYLKATVDASTAVVVSNADQLGASTLRRLREHGTASPALILIGAPPDLLDRLGVSVGSTSTLRGQLTPDCELDLFRGVLVDVPPAPALPAPGCFGDRGGVLFKPAPDDRSVQLLSDGALLSNDRVLDGDNAAAALRLLGQQQRLVWYVADSHDTTSADSVSVVPLLPRALVPGLWLLALAVLAFVLLRGRRLGPLVREPLPVVVRATESTESRGRLYRRTRDRDHVSRVLRTATRRRLAATLSLPREVALASLVVAVARASGREPDEVGALLVDRPVPDDSSLADLGRGLLQIENEVRDR